MKFGPRRWLRWSLTRDGHAKLQGNLFLVPIVPPAEPDGYRAALIGHGHQPETAFALFHAVDPLAVRAALDARGLVERSGAHHRDADAAIGGVIAELPVVRGEHVGVSVQSRQTSDVVLFDEIGDFLALGGENTPVVFPEWISTAAEPKPPPSKTIGAAASFAEAGEVPPATAAAAGTVGAFALLGVRAVGLVSAVGIAPFSRRRAHGFGDVRVVDVAEVIG